MKFVFSANPLNRRSPEDVAKRIDGKWMIIELGDGQVAGLPDKVDIIDFYQALLKCLLV